MLTKKKYYLILICFLFSCRNDTVHITSLDNRHSITIITQNETRYLIDGNHRTVPKENYVKFDIGRTDREVGDQIVGCWDEGNLKWVISMDKAHVIENKLDSNLFKFLPDFPVDDRKVPSIKKFIGPGCFSISFEYGQLVEVKGAAAR